MTEVCPSCGKKNRLHANGRRGLRIYVKSKRSRLHWSSRGDGGPSLRVYPTKKPVQVKGRRYLLSSGVVMGSRDYITCGDPWHDPKPAPLPPLPPEAERVYTLAERRIARAQGPKTQAAKAKRDRARQGKDRR